MLFNNYATLNLYLKYINAKDDELQRTNLKNMLTTSEEIATASLV
jgi:hypothetical protein